MSSRHIVDTGPLVAFLNARDHHHRWAQHALVAVKPPLLTCEAVIAETQHLLTPHIQGQSALLELMTTGLLLPTFRLSDEAAAVRRLTARYSDSPMSLADACLVRMSELHEVSVVITVDRDFLVYRKNGRQVIDVISPFA